MTEGIPGARLQHVAMRVRDVQRSLQFYIEGMGFQRCTEFGGSPKIDLGSGTLLELFPLEDEHLLPVEGVIVHFAILTSDCAAAVEVARAAGAKIVMEPKVIDEDSDEFPSRKIAFFEGLEGERIELVEVIQRDCVFGC